MATFGYAYLMTANVPHEEPAESPCRRGSVVRRRLPRTTPEQAIGAHQPLDRAAFDIQALAPQLAPDGANCAADRLDPEQALVLVDEGAQRLVGCGSRSRAKNADAALRISLARRNSRFSRSSSLIRCASALVMPGRAPPSISVWRTHLRTVLADAPSFSATSRSAATHWRTRRGARAPS